MALQKVAKVGSISALLQEYDTLREQKKVIDNRMKTLAEKIKEDAEKNGVKDDKGSYYAEDGHFVYGKQAKKSINFKLEEAIAFFKRKRWTDCIRTIETVNEEKVTARIERGELKIKDLEEITTTNTTYAIDVKKKEEVPTVEESTVSAPIAASSKSRSIPTAKRGR
jgi:hypothetical protein